VACGSEVYAAPPSQEAQAADAQLPERRTVPVKVYAAVEWIDAATASICSGVEQIHSATEKVCSVAE